MGGNSTELCQDAEKMVPAAASAVSPRGSHPVWLCMLHLSWPRTQGSAAPREAIPSLGPGFFPPWAGLGGPHSRTGSTDRVLSSHLGQPGLVSAACICQHRGSLLVARCAAAATSTSRGTQREGWPVVRKQGTVPRSLVAPCSTGRGDPTQRSAQIAPEGNDWGGEWS